MALPCKPSGMRAWAATWLTCGRNPTPDFKIDNLGRCRAGGVGQDPGTEFRITLCAARTGQRPASRPRAGKVPSAAPRKARISGRSGRLSATIQPSDHPPVLGDLAPFVYTKRLRSNCCCDVSAPTEHGRLCTLVHKRVRGQRTHFGMCVRRHSADAQRVPAATVRSRP